MLFEKEALDWKEYYQERLKNLGPDFESSPDDNISNPDMNFGHSRAPGGADYNWYVTLFLSTITVEDDPSLYG